MSSRLIHRTIDAPPPRVRAGEGIYLITEDGRRIIDGSGGAAVSALGHGHPRVIEAMRRQMEALCYSHTSFFTSAAAEELAEIVVGDEPGGLTHAWFCSSGSEAMEAALKLARQYHLERGEPQRARFIARRQSYHGTTLGALGVGGSMMRRPAFAPMLAPVFDHVSPAFAYRCRRDDETEAEYTARLAAELEAAFAAVGPGTVAAFVAETMVGATTGCVTAPAGYFRAVREVCDRHGALLILDEVMCGMGRTGTMHAWEQEGVTPDIQTVAKGLGGGFQPIGGILAAGRVIAALRAGSGVFRHGQTYQGHPVACAAALAVQKVIREDGLLEAVRERGAQLEQALHERLGNHAHVGDIRGRGLFYAVELVEDRAGKREFDPALGVNARIKREALARGLACYAMAGTIDGARGDHVILAPPYTSSAAEIDRMAAILGDAVDAALPQ